MKVFLILLKNKNLLVLLAFGHKQLNNSVRLFNIAVKFDQIISPAFLVLNTLMSQDFNV